MEEDEILKPNPAVQNVISRVRQSATQLITAVEDLKTLSQRVQLAIATELDMTGNEPVTLAELQAGMDAFAEILNNSTNEQVVAIQKLIM